MLFVKYFSLLTTLFFRPVLNERGHRCDKLRLILDRHEKNYRKFS